MTPTRWLALAALTLASPLAVHASKMPAEDMAAGAKDHPLLSRFAGSRLVGYSFKQFTDVTLPVGKQVEKDRKNLFEKELRLEGALSRFNYVYPSDRSSLEVMRNYEEALKKAGFTTLFACEKLACGKELGEMMGQRIQTDLKYHSASHLEAYNYGRMEPRLVVATGKKPDGAPVHALVYVAPPVQDRLGGVYIEVVEGKPMETGKVSATLDAESMARGITAEGKVAVYGVYFDTDRADIKPESKAALAEMAKLLKSQPSLKVHIVGHTDNQGTMARNLDLSQRRAESVVKALAGEHRIEPGRLNAKGVASFAPVASNDSEAGREKNRRVELVKQ